MTFILTAVLEASAIKDLEPMIGEHGHGSRSKKLSSHIWKHNHQSGRANREWYVALEPQSPPQVTYFLLQAYTS